MKTTILTLSFFLLFSWSAKAQSNCFEDSIQNDLHFLKANQQTPEQYIASKWEEHDIVIVGEVHPKKEYCELIAKAIESAPINYFATEFVKTSNSERINQIVTAKEFDRIKAIDILRDYTWPIWGFEEYLNIIYSVWNANSKMMDPKHHIQIIGLDSEWSQYNNMCGEKQSAMDLFKQNKKREENMVEALKAKYIPGSKILVHNGFAHALFNFKARFAAELYSDYKESVFQICLHQQFEGDPKQMTISKDIEKIMEANNNTPIGFDVESSPFAKIYDPSCFYFKVPQHKCLKDIAMGYIFLKPYSKLRIVTWIPDFINESNFKEAKCVSQKMRFIKTEPQSVQELNEQLSKYFKGK
jgi:hypothetical protein